MHNSQINRAMRIKERYRPLSKTCKPVIVRINSKEGQILKSIGFTLHAQDDEFEILTKPFSQTTN